WNIKDCAAIFHVFVPFNMQDNINKTNEVRKVLAFFYPDIPVIGCSATGEIFNGTMCDHEIVVSAMIFEDPDTRVEICPYYAIKDQVEMDDLLNMAKDTPDLKGVEIVTAAPYQPLEAAREYIDQLPENIEVFGSVAVGDDFQKAFIFADDYGYSRDSSACVLYIGKELHMYSDRMFGWKAIGYPLTVTRSEGDVVYELDGKPAYDVYNHYLHIHKDRNFFYDALQFPWEVQVDESTTYIRHAKSVNADGSIRMSTNIPQGAKIRISYGEPRRIMNHTRETEIKALEFAPQAIYMVNCMGRKLFWNDNYDIEISEISKYVETTGFSALGEILRYKGKTVLNNLSIVLIAMREGPVISKPDVDIKEYGYNMSLTHRLAIFINTITEELMEKNEQLTKMLYKSSHDALTGLLNRGAIEQVIFDAVKNEENWHLIMFDIDDFKQVNDNFGHSEGDNTLKALSEYLIKDIDALPNVEVGRWGGEEFMLFLSDYTDDEVLDIVEKMRNEIKQITVDSKKISVSLGVTKHKSKEEALVTIDRVDELLYLAKNKGKDKVCSDITNK
ncbi:sensor domain-containing diguanylate cyclase, partial [Pseudobutyrivibrio sp.]|uniref:sensor domain-containing diguanylate cyclase n=1 Tax=Pseudobutyrivibrio sp. TaxID=2014367 RepID=UPI001B703D48